MTFNYLQFVCLCIAMAFCTMSIICIETRRRMLGRPHGPGDLLNSAITYLLFCFLALALACVSASS